MVMESILDSVKQAIGGIEPEDTTFDKDLIMFTNGALMVMTQLGVGVMLLAIRQSYSFI